MPDLFSSALAQAAAIKNGSVSATEMATAYLERIEKFNPEVNAIIWLDQDAVLDSARAVDRSIAAGENVGPFAGVPLPIKDLNSAIGQPNTFSSLGVAERIETEDDLVVALLRDAGFTFMGRSNSPEFGALTVSENARHGKTRNPWNLQFTSGGSSGGASAAVAAGFSPVALASDGGGSIRVPSAATGLVGLKPSRGRVPSLVQPWEHSTVEGSITRTVADTAAILDVISQEDRLGWYTAPRQERPFLEEVGAPTGQLRIGLLLEAPTGLHVDEECINAAMKAARALEHLGHIVTPVAPLLFSPEAVHGFINVMISSAVFAAPFDDPTKADPYIRYRWEQAKQFHSGEYAALAMRLQAESRMIVSQWGRDFDVLLTPTTACETPLVGTVYDEANNDPAGPRLTEARMVSFTAFCNIAGLPAISLPVHTAANGMPVGAQLIGGPFDEATLIRLASAMEEAFCWQNRHADLESQIRVRT